MSDRGRTLLPPIPSALSSGASIARTGAYGTTALLVFLSVADLSYGRTVDGTQLWCALGLGLTIGLARGLPWARLPPR